MFIKYFNDITTGHHTEAWKGETIVEVPIETSEMIGKNIY